MKNYHTMSYILKSASKKQIFVLLFWDFFKRKRMRKLIELCASGMSFHSAYKQVKTL
jgi:hypothetical protein